MNIAYDFDMFSCVWLDISVWVEDCMVLTTGG